MTNTPDGTGNNESIGALRVHDAIDELLTAETPEEDNVEQVEESVEETQAETEEVEQETAEGNEEEPTEDVAETSEDDAESDEEPDAEEEAEESVYVVEIDGKEMTPDEIKAELNSNGLRQSDYTKKTQALAEEKRAFDAQKQQTQALEQKLSETLQYAEQILNDRSNEPNWSELSQKVNPQTYNQIKAKWEEGQKQLENIKLQRQQLADKQKYDAQVATQQQALSEEKRLIDMFPAWKDPTVFDNEWGNVKDYLKKDGIPDNVVSQINSADAIKYVWKAMKYDALQDGKTVIKKKIKDKPKVVKSGTPKTKAEAVSSRKRQAFARLEKTGSKEDALNYLLTT